MTEEAKMQMEQEATSNKIDAHNAKVLAAAKWYINRGWAVFPVHSIKDDGQCTCGRIDCGDAGKHPTIQRGFKGASKDIEQIEKWFGPSNQYHNIGLATGNVSGMTVIDIDVGPNKHGAETWAELIAEHGEPVTLRAVTGSGGYHVFFQYNSALKSDTNTLGPGVDSRNDGGYVVAAPSRHRSGGSYDWDRETLKGELAPLPAHLVAKKVETRGRPRKDDLARKKYTIAEIESMLEFIDSSDRQMWVEFGIILGRHFDRSDEAWELYTNWSDKGWDGKDSTKRSKVMHDAFYDMSQNLAHGKERTIGTIVFKALEGGWTPRKGLIEKEWFTYVGEGNCYVYYVNDSRWQAIAVDAAIGSLNDNGKLIKASDWLRTNRFATTFGNYPADDHGLIDGSEVGADGRVRKNMPGNYYNLFRKAEPPPEWADAAKAGPFLDHVRKIFPQPSPAPGQASDADQFLDYMAHRVQRPWERVRFALLIAGEMGTGKDTCVEMCAKAIGPWNIANIDPGDVESNFNEYAAAVLVRINEASNTQDVNKWRFNEDIKTLIAGGPDDQTINPKYGTKYRMITYNGTVLTTNHLASGIYIPENDRRYDVLAAATLEEMGLKSYEAREKYFNELNEWKLSGGDQHVHKYLLERDISKFKPGTGQRKTKAHRSTVVAGKTNDAWLIDALDAMGDPSLFRLDHLTSTIVQAGEFTKAQLGTRIGHALVRAGYRQILYIKADGNFSGDGRWSFPSGKKSAVWCKEDLPEPSRDECLALGEHEPF